MCACVLACVPLTAAAPVAAPRKLQVLAVGGGPDPSHNQVAIESNVRYLETLLGEGAARTVLFASGDPGAKTVQYQVEPPKRPTDADIAFDWIFSDTVDAPVAFRASQLKDINGPSKHDAIRGAFDRLAGTDPASPVLLYFTGHGSPNQANLDGNFYDLWGEKGLTPAELAEQIGRLPKGQRVTVVMVQCFSGAFGNLLFRKADPAGALEERPICGFFATTRERVAAGCTPELNEAYYRDFTSYFLAALTGVDRLGRRVPSADYNHDGRVGMDEAYAYSLVHDASIDVPVATSDVFLRRFVKPDQAALESTPFDEVVSLASPLQRIALKGLAAALGDRSQQSVKHAWEVATTGMSGRRSGGSAETQQARATLRHYHDALVKQFPLLESRPDTSDFRHARVFATLALANDAAGVKKILAAAEVVAQGQDEAAKAEVKSALALRLVRLANSVLLEGRLRASADKDVVAAFDRLKQLESANPFAA